MTAVLVDSPASVTGVFDALVDRFPQAVRPGDQLPRMPEEVHLAKAASYTYLPQLKGTFFNDSSSNDSLSPRSPRSPTASDDLDRRSFSPTGGASPTTPTSETQPLPKTDVNFKTRAHRDSKISIKTLDLGSDPESPSSPKAEAPPKSPVLATAPAQPVDEDRGRTSEQNGQSVYSQPGLSRSLNRLRRHSWLGSRSPSPKPRPKSEVVEPVEANEPPKPTLRSPTKRRSLPALVSMSERRNNKAESRSSSPSKPSLFRRGSTSLRNRFSSNSAATTTSTVSAPTPTSVLSPKSPSTTTRPSLPAASLASTPSLPPRVPDLAALPKSWSTDGLPALANPRTSIERIPPVPRRITAEKMLGARAEVRRKDEMYSVFRSLDMDYQKFQSKTVSLKSSAVRTTILPFLKNQATYASVNRLRVEDLDRRVNVLNRWWTALLDMLYGKNTASVSGTDRPAVLDAIIGIMERPEWRAAPSAFCPLKEKAGSFNVSPNTSKTSLASSTESDFLTESVHHNVRNMFIQNIRAQMCYVLDKMSLRTTPASIVQFCGKTCAYAFFFCPGAADILVRIWSPSVDNLRRVMDEFGASKGPEAEQHRNRIVSSFPPFVQQLNFSSPLKTFRELRKPSSPPLGTADMPWHGPWVSRWMGKESDLFYVFVKWYHVLAMEYLPEGASKLDRIYAPGMALVYAQIVANLNATIYRHSHAHNQEEHLKGASSITFDDVLSEPDATVSAVPLPPANAQRLMAENRLVMLLRDFLSDRCSHLEPARRVFAETFNELLKVAAKKTSAFDQNACYSLCDLLDETVVILTKYENSLPGKELIFDWPFWITVFKEMVKGHNTTIEIRLYALLYSIWPTIAESPSRKEDLCFRLLLEPEFFESRFNHWCPMVRAYFMRLLCWRVARTDSDSGLSRDELAIVSQLKERLRSVWAHFIYLTDEAQELDRPLPTTAPCNPAPYRRLIIIRTDPVLPSPKGTSFSAFDQAMTPMQRRTSMLSLAEATGARPPSAGSTNSDSSELEEPKHRWGLLRTIISPSRGRQPPKPSAKSNTPAASTPSKLLDSAPSPTTTKPATDSASQQAPTHRSFCFRFSLEHIDRRYPAPHSMRLSPPRMPQPAQQLLQSHWTATKPMEPLKPVGREVESARYSGRSLAEWSIVVAEYQSFVERRRSEGVPSRRLVETPTLGVEVFRKPG